MVCIVRAYAIEPLAQCTDSGDETDTEAGLDYNEGLVFNDIEPFIIDLDDGESLDGSYNCLGVKGLMSNMVTVDPPTMEEDDQLSTWEDPWIHRLNIQYGDRFEQRESPTEDKVVQVNMGDEANLKPIFISDSLPSEEREELIAIIREYFNVFAWNYEDMPGLDPNVMMHCLNIKSDAKPVEQ
ncbi:uncharacterized protein A4U43_C02F12980 [Asparagus officinalis]|uniref:Uncharacterized protein n=1 Tax=Asparagus officinalis TaxID=4686 RepID=A0A5P1FIQ3_ASPOF|nr:uncharacterized protein A4U43_C02F12980 [Asparagus officinalis]